MSQLNVLAHSFLLSLSSGFFSLHLKIDFFPTVAIIFLSMYCMSSAIIRLLLLVSLAKTEKKRQKKWGISKEKWSHNYFMGFKWTQKRRRKKKKKISTRKITICLMITCSNTFIIEIKVGEKSRAYLTINFLSFILNEFGWLSHSLLLLYHVNEKSHDWRSSYIRTHIARIPWPLHWMPQNTK